MRSRPIRPTRNIRTKKCSFLLAMGGKRSEGVIVLVTTHVYWPWTIRAVQVEDADGSKSSAFVCGCEYAIFYKLFVCVCLYVHVYICMFVCLCLYGYIGKCQFACARLCACWMCMFVRASLYLLLCACIFFCIFVCVCFYEYVYMYVFMCMILCAGVHVEVFWPVFVCVCFYVHVRLYMFVCVCMCMFVFVCFNVHLSHHCRPW